MPLLLSGNLSARMLRISLNELTKTFQDAVTITRKLGIPYLWIDALCIIQDDNEDWAQEAARMAAVYKSAYLVIAATSSNNGDDGCLRPRYSSHDLAACLEVPSTVSLHVQRQICHRAIIEWQATSITMPLLDRAWCFQERLLASRILHYTEDEMMWECQEELWCECQKIKFDNPWNPTLKTFKLFYGAAVASMEPNIRATSWDGVVREYSQRALTFGTDRLPAISGIAKEIALPAMGRYLAGLWEFQFPQALLWRSVGGVVDRPEVLPRPSQYQGPTWSWASIASAVTLQENRSLTPICRVIDVTCTSTTADSYGHIRDGRLEILGPTMAVTLQRTSRGTQSTCYDVLTGRSSSETHAKSRGISMTSDIELIESTIPAIMLLIAFHDGPIAMKGWGQGLVLVQSTRHTGCWERIGLVSGDGLKLDHTTETKLILV
jgi:hypothetical protein